MIDRVEADLRQQFLAVRDQGPRPTCLAYAVSGAHECIGQFGEHLSPEYLYHYAKSGRSRGCEFSRMAGTLANEGQPMEGDCPTQKAAPPRSWRPPAGVTVYRRNSVPDSPGIDEVRASIAAGSPPVIGIQLPTGFYRPQQPYVVDDRGPPRGYHAVVAIGYGQHNSHDVVLIRNSWGDSWAESGHAWLTESFLRVHLVDVLRLTDAV